jgi:hypothetical protein
MQVMDGLATTDKSRCLHPKAAIGASATAALARTMSPGGAVAAELTGAGTSPLPCGPGAGVFLGPVGVA